MTKGKWKGLDLVRKDTGAESKQAGQRSVPERGAGLLREDVAPATPAPTSRKEPISRLGRIHTRRVLRGPDGEVYDLTERKPVWLVQIDDINQLFISDALKSRGHEVVECPRLDQLKSKIADAEEPPKLIVIEARVVGQQTPFFRKMILPHLETLALPCLLIGVTSAAQESSFRSWYDGPLLVGGDLDELTETVQTLL